MSHSQHYRFDMWPMLLTVLLFIPLTVGAVGPADGQPKPIDPVRLVVMIEAVQPGIRSVQGAGLIVGRLPSGSPVIVTARHVVNASTDRRELRIRFHDEPARIHVGRVLRDDFGAGLDLAVVTVEAPKAAPGIPFPAKLPVGRLEGPLKIEEKVGLIGQTEGVAWNPTSRTQMVTADQGSTVRVNSPEAGPGVSGGVVLDSSDRVVGIALNDDRYVISVLKLSVIEKQLQAADLPFSIVQGETKIASPHDYQAGMRAALRVPGAAALAQFVPDAAAAAALDLLLDEPDTLKAFAKNTKSPAAIGWLREVAERGFKPDRLVEFDGRKRSLLRMALAEQNVTLASTLLDSGASPYIYEEVWGQEHSKPYFLYPLDAVRELSASTQEKRELLEAMIRAGLTVTEAHEPNASLRPAYKFSDLPADLRDVAIPVQNGIRSAPNNIICQRASGQDYDWCALVEKLPSYVKVRKGGWMDAFSRGDLVKPLSVADGYLYLMTASPVASGAEGGAGLMRISKDAQEIVWYRYMRSSAGMGHCEELRRVPNPRPDGSYRTCWRRQVMVKGQEEGTYVVRHYENVVYLTGK